jgi:hypothetical protein
LELPEWISAIANVFTAVGIGLAWWSFRGDHERSRREKAIELISLWALNMNKRVSAARKLVEALDEASIRSLFSQEPFSINKKHIGLLQAALESRIDEQSTNEIHLDETKSSELRWQIITFLNNLESVCSAWRHNVADKEIIAEQFRYLVSPTEGHYILEKFRIISGGNHTYPAIEEFVNQLKRQYQKTTAGKKRVA